MAGLRVVTDRTPAGQPALNAGNGEELMHVLSGVSLVLGNRLPLSPGTLYITTRKVVWLSDTDRERGYAVDFLNISLHAVSRDPESYPSPCIYAQIDIGDEDDDDSEGSDTECNETLDLSRITEMRVVPSDPNQVDALFQMFCECAELNPEPIEEEEEEHNWIFSAEQLENEAAEEGEETEWMVMQNGSHPIGCSNEDPDLAHTILQLQINDQRFEDAEEMDSDNHNRQH
ncbi:PREDICTED: chloride conductance regulatory protein ICln [Ipomoea nil]|uniref:chloride conductance regulatory protein ICln n=1 Tax=Ipomoea nil TaxID=35883 RepID=UPI000900DA59|nr:PREDICTED: chloride conductance regulatory protein ICln [Ipomoea nil]